jgi:hypothetical protein
MNEGNDDKDLKAIFRIAMEFNVDTLILEKNGHRIIYSNQKDKYQLNFISGKVE